MKRVLIGLVAALFSRAPRRPLLNSLAAERRQRRRRAAAARTRGYGYEFSDDPLAAGGFGPNDATIRVRPARCAHDSDSSAHVFRARDVEERREPLIS